MGGEGGAQNSEWIWKDHLEHHALTNKLLSCAPCWAGTVSTRTRESKTVLLATYGPPPTPPKGAKRTFPWQHLHKCTLAQ